MKQPGETIGEGEKKQQTVPFIFQGILLVGERYFAENS